MTQLIVCSLTIVICAIGCVMMMTDIREMRRMTAKLKKENDQIEARLRALGWLD